MPNNTAVANNNAKKAKTVVIKLNEEQESLIYEHMDTTEFRCSDLPWSPTAEELQDKLFDGFDRAIVSYTKEKEPRSKGRKFRILMNYILYAFWLSETCDDMDPRAYHKLQDWLKTHVEIIPSQNISKGEETT